MDSETRPETRANPVMERIGGGNRGGRGWSRIRLSEQSRFEGVDVGDVDELQAVELLIGGGDVQQLVVRADGGDASLSSTAMRVARRTVERRCAMTTTVRPVMRLLSAVWTSDSLSVSRAEVASSRMRTGAFFRMARAMARRWRSPPERRKPFSPMMVS